MWWLTFGALCITLLGMTTMTSSKLFKDIDNQMKFFQIIEDVIPKSPPTILKVMFNKTKVSLGTALVPFQVLEKPKLDWHVEDPKMFYTLLMVDPDSPSMLKPVERHWIHWLIVNIPGKNIKDGETIVEYKGDEPPPSTGFHRHMLLLYKQPEKKTFDEPHICNKSLDERKNFSVSKFVKKYNMEDHLFAGNFYLAENIDSVRNFNYTDAESIKNTIM